MKCPTCGHTQRAPRVPDSVSLRLAAIGASEAPRATRRASGLPARFRSDPNYRPMYGYDAAGVRTAPFGTLPADWAFSERGTREHTPEERSAIARMNEYISEHRGQVAIIDEASNSVTGWKEAAA